jgi:hypothetical protein
MRHDVRILATFCTAACLLANTTLRAQNAPIPVTIQEPASGFKTGPVIPVGLSVPNRLMNGPRVPSVEKHIRINIRYALLDRQTRGQLYQRLGADRLKTIGSQVPNLQEDPAAAELADTRGTEFIAKSTRVTTCTLNGAELEQLLSDVAASSASQVTRAPSLVLIDGQDSEVTDLVQRPFVVDLQRQATAEKEAVESVVQVLNEGISIQLNASLTPSQRFHVISKITFEKLLDVETEEVFGIRDEPMTVQVPVHQRKTVSATENLQLGQTLLVDPYVKHEGQTSQTTGVPILSSIPYISKSFTNTQTVPLTQHMIVLIQPLFEAQPASPSQP